MIAGIQIAITQPIRLDDVVIIENEWGRVEEITGTYVVVKIWDDRRLVVPLQRIIENPFQNWARTSSSLIGTVFFWVDYSVPIEPLRVEAERLCKEVPHLWDGKVYVLLRTMSARGALTGIVNGIGESWQPFTDPQLLPFPLNGKHRANIFTPVIWRANSVYIKVLGRSSLLCRAWCTRKALI